MDPAENFLSEVSRFAGKDNQFYKVHLKVNTPNSSLQVVRSIHTNFSERSLQVWLACQNVNIIFLFNGKDHKQKSDRVKRYFCH